MKYLFCAISLSLLIQLSVFSQGTVMSEIEIWPGVGPGSDTLTITENILERTYPETCTRNWAMEKVTVPTITPVVPDTANGCAFLICPGGSYQRVVYDVEGIDIANWLCSIGVTGFILKYRLPADDHIDKKDVPLQDAQRAIRYIKMHAAEWDLDTNKIGISGASAGGHVASTLATSFDKEVYTAKDSIDSISARPYYMFLLYPVVSMEDDITHLTSRTLLIGEDPSQELIDEFSAEKNVSSLSPKTFLAHAADDAGVSPDNSKRLAQALTDSGVVVQLNIYTDGGHGVGICKAVGTDFENWTTDCTNWLYELELTDTYIQPDTTDTADTSDTDTTGSSAINSLNSTTEFNIYPNPARNFVTVSADNIDETNIELTIINATGQEIKRTNLKPLNGYLSEQIDTQNLTSGLYFFKLKTENSYLSKSIMIK